MKVSVIITCSIAAIGLLALALSMKAEGGSGAQNITPTFTTSRYMLLSGSFQERGAQTVSGAKSESAVFKLDTYSGDAWMLEVKALPDGSRHMSWVTIPHRNKKPANISTLVDTGRMP